MNSIKQYCPGRPSRAEQMATLVPSLSTGPHSVTNLRYLRMVSYGVMTVIVLLGCYCSWKELHAFLAHNNLPPLGIHDFAIISNIFVVDGLFQGGHASHLVSLLFFPCSQESVPVPFMVGSFNDYSCMMERYLDLVCRRSLYANRPIWL